MSRVTIAALIATAALVGCASAPPNTVLVQWHKMEHAQVQQVCTEGLDDGKRFIAACYKMIDKVCHIYAGDGQTKMAALGHELKHCFDGNFHDNDGNWFELQRFPDGKVRVGAGAKDYSWKQ